MNVLPQKLPSPDAMVICYVTPCRFRRRIMLQIMTIMEILNTVIW